MPSNKLEMSNFIWTSKLERLRQSEWMNKTGSEGWGGFKEHIAQGN